MLTSALENLLNRGLPRSPRARQLCAELAGARVAIDVRGLATLLVESDGQQLKLTTGAAESAQARISGGALALASLGGAGGAETLRSGAVEMSGDLALAEKMRELLVLLRPDPEEELARAIGDVPAHQLGRMARAVLSFGQRAGQTAARNFAEYFAHERRDLVSAAEARSLLAGIDQVRDQIERLEARLELAAQAVAQRTGAAGSQDRGS